MQPLSNVHGLSDSQLGAYASSGKIIQVAYAAALPRLCAGIRSVNETKHRPSFIVGGRPGVAVSRE
jgi:hypothetical protein